MQKRAKNTKRDTAFIAVVRTHYKTHGRHHLPWRTTTDPYKILVSEIMLQQTQVERVLPKYEHFLKRFPTAKRLAAAPLADVLREWQGLGYNRRAKLLWGCAKSIAETHRGVFPVSFEELKSLPGIGPYTAGAVMAFAYNKPVPLIETNIRTVYLHHFFKRKTGVTDAAIMRVVERTLDRRNPGVWYAALMDYGAHLKKQEGNANVRSRHYAKQSKFAGSDREIRGAIIRALAENSLTQAKLLTALPFDAPRITAQLSKLVGEGMVRHSRRVYQLP